MNWRTPTKRMMTTGAARPGTRRIGDTIKSGWVDMRARVPERFVNWRRIEPEQSNVGRLALGFLVGAATGAGIVGLVGGSLRRRSARRQEDSGGMTESMGTTATTDRLRRRRGGAFWRSGAESDRRVEERVRSAMGHVVQRASAIDVSVTDGVVVLEGRLHRSEMRPLLARIRRVRGVHQVENNLEFDSGERAASYGQQQDEEAAGGTGRGLMAVRLALGAAGVTLVGFGLNRRGTAAGGALALAGGVLTAASLALSRRRSRGAKPFYAEHTVVVDAPVSDVFRFWDNVENWPRFMAHLEEVKVRDARHSHWVATGPLGVAVSWDAEVTTRREDELIGWRSLPGSVVDTAGTVRFTRLGDDRTRVTVRMSYNPPAGRLGHLTAQLFGEDPQQALQDDLARAKSVIERGSASRRESRGYSAIVQPNRGEVAGM